MKSVPREKNYNKPSKNSIKEMTGVAFLSNCPFLKKGFALWGFLVIS